MSEPSGSSAPAKQAKQPKQPKPSAQTAADGSSSAPKGKSAKELKKEKRAAAVSARGGGAAPAGGPDGDRASAGPSDAPPNRQRPGLVPSAAAQTGSSAHIPHSQPQLRRANTQPPHQPEPATSHAQFFSHLPPHLPPDTSVAFGSSKLHPDIIRLGVLMANGTLRGANARTMALLAAFQEVIRDYECPDQADLWKDLPIYLSPMIAWLEGCRPKGVGGGNAIRWLKSEINRLGEGDERTDAEQKQWLVDSIGVYIRDRIEFADQLIAENAKEKINPGDTVVTYARSSIVERVLLKAWRDLKEQDPSASFEVVIVDSRPLNEGRRLLDSLTYAGVPCTYVLLSQLVPILQRADLILLGASALHSDGSLYSRSGTALVATLAKEHRIPVVACVETYKFGERVILDGLASNELGDAEALLSIPVNKALGVKKPLGSSLTPLSLMYDLTPPSLITAVCTEIGFIPPSSVPTVLGKAGGAA